MTKKEVLDLLLKENQGVLKTSDAINAGISKTYFLEFVKKNELEKVSQGIYMALDSWTDELYLLQARFGQIVFSHETALYLLGLSDREPLQFTVTVKRGYNSCSLINLGAKIYTVRNDLHKKGVITVNSPAGHKLRVYDAERTICDIIRSRSNVEIQDFQYALKEYVRRKNKDLPLLMRYAEDFRVEKILRQYLEVLL